MADPKHGGRKVTKGTLAPDHVSPGAVPPSPEDTTKHAWVGGTAAFLPTTGTPPAPQQSDLVSKIEAQLAGVVAWSKAKLETLGVPRQCRDGARLTDGHVRRMIEANLESFGDEKPRLRYPFRHGDPDFDAWRARKDARDVLHADNALAARWLAQALLSRKDIPLPFAAELGRLLGLAKANLIFDGRLSASHRKRVREGRTGDKDWEDWFLAEVGKCAASEGSLRKAFKKLATEDEKFRERYTLGTGLPVDRCPGPSGLKQAHSKILAVRGLK